MEKMYSFKYDGGKIVVDEMGLYVLTNIVFMSVKRLNDVKYINNENMNDYISMLKFLKELKDAM